MRLCPILSVASIRVLSQLDFCKDLTSVISSRQGISTSFWFHRLKQFVKVSRYIWKSVNPQILISQSVDVNVSVRSRSVNNTLRCFLIYPYFIRESCLPVIVHDRLSTTHFIVLSSIQSSSVKVEEHLQRSIKIRNQWTSLRNILFQTVTTNKFLFL